MKCYVCENRIDSLLNLNLQPLSFNYTKYHNTLDYNDLHINNEVKYPLNLYYCNNCFHMQLDTNIKVENIESSLMTEEIVLYSLFRLYNLNPDSNKKTLNISCDEINLCIFKNLLNVICPEILCTSLHSEPFDIIFTNKVENLKDRIYKIGFIFCPVLLKSNIDKISHDYLNYYNSNSMNMLCAKNSIKLNNVFTTEDNIYLFEITNDYTNDSNISQVLLNEVKMGFYDKNTILNYKLKSLKYINNFHNTIINYKLKNKTIIAFGNSNTLLNCCNIDDTLIDYIIDEKINLFTPGTNLLICDIDSIKLITNNTIIIIFKDYNLIKKSIIEKKKEFNIVFPIKIVNYFNLKTEII